MRGKEVTDLIRKLERLGVTVTQSKSGHYKATKDGATVTIPATPSDHRSLLNTYAECRRTLGIDLRKPHKKKDATNDFALARLRERTLRQMERGATFADLARLATAQSEDKRIGGWKSWEAANHGIRVMMGGGRLVKPNHDSLASAISKLESSDDDVFVKHLEAAAERFDMKRHAPAPPVVPDPVVVEPTPEVVEPESAALAAAGDLGPDKEQAAEPLDEPTWRKLKQDIRDAARGGVVVPQHVEVTVKIELGDETRALIEKLIRGRG